MLGPIEYLVVAFPGNNFNGEIMRELTKLADSGTIRVIDLIFLHKDAEGNVTVLEIEEESPEIVATLDTIKQQTEDLLAEADTIEAASLLENDSSAGILLFEHVWARDFKRSVVNAGGILVANERVRDESVQQALAAINNETKE